MTLLLKGGSNTNWVNKRGLYLISIVNGKTIEDWNVKSVKDGGWKLGHYSVHNVNAKLEPACTRVSPTILQNLARKMLLHWNIWIVGYVVSKSAYTLHVPLLYCSDFTFYVSLNSYASVLVVLCNPIVYKETLHDHHETLYLVFFISHVKETV